MYVKKGEIWIIDLGTNKGSEQNGKRPCLILKASSKEKTCIILPCSHTKRKSSFNIHGYKWIPHQIRAIDESRRLRKIERIPETIFKKIQEKVFEFLK